MADTGFDFTSEIDVLRHWILHFANECCPVPRSNCSKNRQQDYRRRVVRIGALARFSRVTNACGAEV
jgi:hypothetical protein